MTARSSRSSSGEDGRDRDGTGAAIATRIQRTRWEASVASALGRRSTVQRLLSVGRCPKRSASPLTETRSKSSPHWLIGCCPRPPQPVALMSRAVSTVNGPGHATALLKKTPRPSEDEVRRGLAGNLCRCTGYNKIVDAVLDASREGEELSETGTAGARA